MQYVNKYSAAFWGTSFVREMTKIPNPEESDTVQELKEHSELSGQAELKLKTEDDGGSELKKGAGNVPLTPTEPVMKEIGAA